MATVTKPLVLDETMKEFNRDLVGILDNITLASTKAAEAAESANTADTKAAEAAVSSSEARAFRDAAAAIVTPSGLATLVTLNQDNIITAEDKLFEATGVSKSEKNIFDERYIDGVAINVNTGVTYPLAEYCASYCIPVIAGKTIYVSKRGAEFTMPFFFFYKADGTYLNYQTYVKSMAVPSEASYLRISMALNDKGSIQLEYDGITQYEPKLSLMQTPSVCKTLKFLTDYKPALQKTIMLSNGLPYYNDGFSEKLCTTDLLDIELLKGKTIHNLENWKAAQAYPIAFYDANKNTIGEAYMPIDTSAETSVNITLTDEILAMYPDAMYVRLGINTNYNFYISDDARDKAIDRKIEGIGKNSDLRYKFNMFDKILFAGDSVTQGFVVEGTQANPQSTYQVIEKYSYPTQFHKIIPQCEFEKKATAGFTCKQWYDTYYANTDFTQYDIVVIELGLNGYLDINDVNVEGTNTNYYKKIIAGIRGQNPDCMIFMSRSSHFSETWMPVLHAIGDAYGCKYLDLHDTRYDNLDDAKYHGYYNNNGTPEVDWAHFTRKGYNAKAFVIFNLIAEQLD